MEDYEKTNREKRMAPKTYKPYWCGSCDRDKVRDGEKCETCGYRYKNKTLKKDT